MKLFGKDGLHIEGRPTFGLYNWGTGSPFQGPFRQVPIRDYISGWRRPTSIRAANDCRGRSESAHRAGGVGVSTS